MGSVLYMTLTWGHHLQCIYDRYLVLPLSPIRENVLESQITDLERGMALTRELELFLANLTVEQTVTFDFGENVKSYDRLVNWMSGHESRADDMILSFKENDRFLPNARSTTVDQLLNITNELLVKWMGTTLHGGDLFGLASTRQLLLEIRQLYVLKMILTAEQRHVDQ